MKITQELLKELLHYDADTGVFTWRERSREWFSKDSDARRWNTRYAGRRAGSVHQSAKGYAWRYIAIFKKARYEHHLAWLYMTGEPRPEQLDHINRDATDNRWCNIQASSVAENTKNSSRRCDNASGISGVHWEARRGKWLARGTCNGKRIHLGYFTEIDEAAMEVLEFRADRGFSREHGLEIAHYHAGAIA